MRHNTFYIGKICVSSSLWLRKNELGIEDIQALVLHRTHIEIAYRHNHEAL